MKRNVFSLLLALLFGIMSSFGQGSLALAATQTTTIMPTGGIYFALPSGGQFDTFAYIAANLSSIQQLVRQTTLQQMDVDINGHMTNFGDFLTANTNQTITNQLFSSYALAHPFPLPSGTMIEDTSGVTIYSPLGTSVTTSTYRASQGTTVTTTSPPSPTLPSPTTAFSPQTYLAQYDANQATNDQIDWTRASANFYLIAQTYEPGTTGTSSFTQLEAGQPVYLFAYQNQGNVDPTAVSWFVNSGKATLTPDLRTWHMNSNTVASAGFVATSPGIYTIQAEQNGVYSVPMVLVVGESQLASTPIALQSSMTGIAPMPSGFVQNPTWQTADSVTYATYQPDQNWIPIDATTTLPLTEMDVLLQSSKGQLWNYRLPVVNQKIQALVESPYQGQVTVTFFPHYFQAMTHAVQTSTGFSYPTSSYTVNVQGTALSTNQQALLASAHRDYNMTPSMDQLAATLLENSPSLDTAIAAISNEASNVIRYNLNELQTVNYIWQDVGTAWATQSGVCEDYSSAAAAMMQSVGIPTQTVVGYANDAWTTLPTSDSNPADAHQWNQSWDGSKWVLYDPTWATNDSSSVANYLTNEFMTATQSLLTTHLTDPNQIGTYYDPTIARY
nr:transglutaminase domain-containing protein [Bacilli bacterium]